MSNWFIKYIGSNAAISDRLYNFLYVYGPASQLWNPRFNYRELAFKPIPNNSEWNEIPF